MKPLRLRVLVCLLLAVSPAHAAESEHWEATLERVAEAVVVLRVTVPRAFDTDLPASESATGFVVDARRGLILTNRHVVKSGPVVAEAVFLDHEEVPLRAVYRDPVHDFGLYQFDPHEVEFMKPAQLELAPEAAAVGTEIRVVGNDAGEKLSILGGTLARLDREAPDYGIGRYNDFNTFYYQAASASSGGSSGSPVVDIRGRALALNAGGSRRASSSFYLPLEVVDRALGFVRRGETVPRGTLQAVFEHVPYDELRRLGLDAETEARARRLDSGETGMLVVREVVPGGPADGRLEPGDVLVSVAGRPVTTFVPLEFALDDHVGREIELEMRRGGEPLSVRTVVGDLHAITPAEYLEVGGAVLHVLSYQQARNFGVPAGAGIFLASSGYMFSRAGVPRGVVITAVDGTPVTSLDDVERLLSSVPDRGRVAVRYFELQQPANEVVRSVAVDRTWFPMRRCRRNGGDGAWPCRASPAPPAAPAAVPIPTRFPEAGSERPVQALTPSLVMVDFDAPLRIDGVHSANFRGTGLVVDAERGLVVVDRETAPTGLGDVTLTFASSVEVPGTVVYLHPVHNLAVVSYDPALLGDTPVESATLRTEPLEPGDEVWLVGLNRRSDVVWRETRVSRRFEPRLPLSDPPRFRQTNAELLRLEDTVPTVGGVLADGRGRVRAFWASFSYGGGDQEPDAFFAGLDASHVEDLVRPLREGRDPAWRGLGVELVPLTLADARHFGLSDAAAQAIEEEGEARPRVLAVARVTAGTPSAGAFRVGDLLLAVNGEPAASFEVVERAGRAPRVRATVLRNGEQLVLDVETAPMDGRGTERTLAWAGALIQDPHPALAEQLGLEPRGVYVSWLWFGSPANRYELRASRRVIEVDGKPTEDLDAFIAAVVGRPDRAPVRLRTVDLEGKERVLTLELDLEFWPTTEFLREGGAWKRIELGGAPGRL